MDSQVLERPLPHNLDAERSALGAVLLDNSALDEVAVLSQDEFFLPQHRHIFAAMGNLRENNCQIDTISLMEVMAKSRTLEAGGGVAYLSQLADGLPRQTNVAHYARIVKEKSTLRKLIYSASAIQEQAMAAGDNVDEILDRATQTIIDLALTSAAPDADGKTYRAAAVSFLASTEDPASSVRIYSGLSGLDTQTGGFRIGELVTLTAGTGVGKTLLAQQIRRRACSGGWHGLYCSAEMTAEHLVSRELATEARVEHWKMRQPERLSREEMGALLRVASCECDKCKILDGELSIQKIRVAARRRKRSTGLHLIILDYDELIDAPGKDEISQQRYVIRAAKALAMELRVCVIVISQLRKALDKDDAARPTLERIYGSGAKSKHSSWILFVDREYVRELKGDETEGRVCILKARDGRTGEILVTFGLDTLRFTDRIPGTDPPPSPRRRSRREKEGDESL